MEKQWLFILLTLLAAAFIPIQTGANAVLRKNLGSGMLSGLVVFIVAATMAIIFDHLALWGL